MELGRKIDSSLNHILFHHKEADGWITLAQKMEDGEFRQYHYKATEIALKLSEWLGEDVYFSQNTFYKPQRKIENLRQLRALYIDVDFYLLNYDINWVLGNIELLVKDREIPNPNFILHSGQGIVCVWLLEPVPYQALPLWQVLQKTFLGKLKRLGGDRVAIDAARVFRLAGTINSASGEQVYITQNHDYRYVLRDLQAEYLPELSPSIEKKRGRPKKVVQLHNIYRLHVTRLKDLTTLLELRDYSVKGYREVICFLYRYWSCCVLEDSQQALEDTLEINGSLTTPLSEVEVIRATKSAEKAWKAKNNKQANEEAIKQGYPGAGYNLKNSTIIEWLDITGEEQKQLETIIDANEKRRRKRERDKLAKREERGSVSREEYLDEQRGLTEDKLWQLQQAMERHPTLTKTQLANHLGIHRSHLYRLLERL